MQILFHPALAIMAFVAADAAAPRVLDLAANDPDLNQLSWMTGSWFSESSGKQVDEHWTHPAGGSIMGVHRDISGGKTVFYEFLRIEKRPDGIFYLASPKGRNPPTEFKLVQTESRRATFENPKHDFPQRIIYWRADDGSLRARIEGKEGDKQKASEWSWQPARLMTQQ